MEDVKYGILVQVYAQRCICMHMCTHRPNLPKVPRLPNLPKVPKVRLPLDGGMVVLKHAES